MKRIIRSTTVLIALAALVACGETEEEPEVGAAVVAEPAEPMAMEGMQMGAAEDPLDAHMAMMEGASGEELVAMLPEHRQLTANMIAQYNREMREMNMSMDAEWNETVDALREDLVRLPEMSPQELQAFIPEHQARIDRLREMHHGMMGDMQM